MWCYFGSFQNPLSKTAEKPSWKGENNLWKSSFEEVSKALSQELISAARGDNRPNTTLQNFSRIFFSEFVAEYQLQE